MATELPRPGVEVVQEFASTSPTITTPTLVPVVVAPFFEVIEALKADGSVNDEAKLASSYNQFEMTAPQSSFPSPRGNIDEVDVLEDTIRVFFNFGGSLKELSQSSAFLSSIDVATIKASIDGTGTAPFSVDKLKLNFQYDSHTAIPPGPSNFLASADKQVVFAATTPGGTLTLQEVLDQINALVPGLASNDGTGHVRLTSLRYGARGSVMVRYLGSSANSALGFSNSVDEYAVNPGFYAADDTDGDLISPRLQIYEGIDQSAAPYISAPDFNDYSIEVGDSVIAEGVNIGAVAIVQSDRLTMEVEQNLMSADSPFAPRRVWLQANSLVYPAPAASQPASMTGTVQSAAATRPYIVAPTLPSFPIAVGQSFDVTVIDDGVIQATQTVVVSTAWSDLSGIVGGINATPNLKFQAYKCDATGVEQTDGNYVGLRTLADNVGSSASITLESVTSGMTMGFTTPPYGDVGEDIRFLPGTPAIYTSADTWANILTAGLVITDLVATTVHVKNPMTGSWSDKTDSVTWNSTGVVPATVALAVTFWNTNAKYTEAYRSTVAGVPDVAGTYLSIKTIGESVGLLAEITTTTDNIAGSSPGVFGALGSKNGTDISLDGKTFKWSIDGNPHVYSTIFVADEDDGGTSIQSVIDKINELTPNVASESSDAPPYLELTSQKYGEASKLLIGDGTVNLLIGFTTAATAYGSGRPNPDLAIGTSGEAIVQGQILRNGLTGIPFDPGSSPVIVAYKGLRLDMSPDAANPGLIVFNDTTTIDEIASPISMDNPGALMAYLAKLNAPGVGIAAIGVPEVSADAPDGTPAGYAKCFEFLENEEVYAMATATQIGVTHQAGLTHINFMSEPEQKGERIYFFNPPMPDRALPATVGSGSDANSTPTANTLTIDVNIAPALIAAGIDPDEDINPTSGAIENEVYIDLGSDDKYYLLHSVSSGTSLTLRTSFATGDGNEDAFFSSTDLPSGIISDAWTVYIRGEKLVIPGSTKPDRNAIAETIQGIGKAYGFRRGFYVFPDQCGINVSGLEQVVAGYYATACIVGMVGQLPPQQGFTNYPITGLTRVVGSNDMFTNRQMNVMAAGGVYVIVQDTEGAPCACRHQLSTDVSSIETRELSITKVIDYAAKFLRGGVRNFIGRSNITQPFLDNLSAVIQGLLYFLQENGNIIGGSINNLVQDSTSPDSVLVDVTLDVPYPCNLIRITLLI